jgi:hypothetical protein
MTCREQACYHGTRLSSLARQGPIAQGKELGLSLSTRAEEAKTSRSSLRSPRHVLMKRNECPPQQESIGLRYVLDRLN